MCAVKFGRIMRRVYGRIPAIHLHYEDVRARRYTVWLAGDHIKKDSRPHLIFIFLPSLTTPFISLSYILL